MQSISSTWDAALKKSHVVTTKAEILRGGAIIENTDKLLRVIGGSVSVDGSASVLRTCRVSIVDPTGLLVPNSPTDTLSPYGNEIKLYRGIGSELKSLGIFRFEGVDVRNEGGITIELEGFDRSSTIQEARFEMPYVIASGTNVVTAIIDMISLQMSGLTFIATATAYTTPLLVFEEGEDPWEKAQLMAESIGMEIFFDVEGRCVIRSIPNPTTSHYVFKYTEGNSSILSSNNYMAAKPSYNKFIVSGETADASAPVRAEAFDNNPTSPTYYYGPFGKRPRFYKSSFIYLATQAQDAANGMLLRSLGGVERLSFNAIPNPAHDHGDVVHVVDSSLGVDVMAVMEAFTIPLSVGEVMPVTTRARRAAA